MSKFLKGTIILLVAGLITRVLGFINRIVIARFIGEEGVGLYMMAVPTFILAITITQLGLPVAISKNVAEAEAAGDHAKIKKILVVSLGTTLALSIIFTPLLLLTAPLLAETLFTDSRTLDAPISDCTCCTHHCRFFCLKRIFSRKTEYETFCLISIH